MASLSKKKGACLKLWNSLETCFHIFLYSEIIVIEKNNHWFIKTQ